MEASKQSIEEGLRGAATFLETHGLEVTPTNTVLPDGQTIDTLHITRVGGAILDPNTLVAGINFVNGTPEPAGPIELQRRLAVPGLIAEVVGPVLLAATPTDDKIPSIYDESFDVLPGMI